jgi:DNA polymerase III gamma/tau subunit
MNPSGTKYSETELRSELKQENINDTKLYYSLVKKDAKNISFFTNDRLLIYDTARRMLYYSNDFKNTPFRTAVPEPKNGQFTPLKHSTFKSPNSGTQLQVRYSGKNAKDEMEAIEWNFTC